MRAGELADSDMVVRRIGVLEEITCASPTYLTAHGAPSSPDEWDGHVTIGFMSSRTRQLLPLDFTVEGETREVTLPMRTQRAHLERRPLGLTHAQAIGSACGNAALPDLARKEPECSGSRRGPLKRRRCRRRRPRLECRSSGPASILGATGGEVDAARTTPGTTTWSKSPDIGRRGGITLTV